MSQQPTIMGPKKYKVPLGKGGLISDWIIIVAICTKNLGNIVHQSSLMHNISERVFCKEMEIIHKLFLVKPVQGS